MSIILDGDKGINQNTTEVTKIPVGTTAERPANPEAGMMRFNTDNNEIEGYDPVLGGWRAVSQTFAESVIATGGTVTDITQDGKQYRVHTFTSDGTFEVTRGGEVEYLVVAGGGSGNNGFINNSEITGGGGGAGGIRTGTTMVASGLPYQAIVGAGGVWVAVEAASESGFNSSFGNIASIGGGGGGKQSRVGANGGSGGGGGSNDIEGGLGTTDQGSNGGTGVVATNTAGGGGGAGGPGGAPTGGVGLTSSITGSSVIYAAGGAGGTTNGGNGVAGTPNTGNGGSGSQQGSSAVGANGGSGIVIVRYRIG